MLQTRAAVVGVPSGFSRSHWIACFIFSFSRRSRRSVFLGALRRRAMVLKVEIIVCVAQINLFFVWESHINLKCRCAMRNNLLSPTKGKGPFRSDVKSDYYKFPRWLPGENLGLARCPI